MTLAINIQDTTTRVWDMRASKQSVAVLRGHMGAIRALRFSPDGGLLAAAEHCDFVQLFETANGFTRYGTVSV